MYDEISYIHHKQGRKRTQGKKTDIQREIETGRERKNDKNEKRMTKKASPSLRVTQKSMLYRDTAYLKTSLQKNIILENVLWYRNIIKITIFQNC